MPIRNTSESYEYDVLLKKIQKVIDEEYGGTAKFVESEKFLEIGFKDTKTERANFFTYLANQTDKTKTVKSVPVLKKLFKGLLGVELTSRVEVIRKTHIISNKPIF